MNRSFRAPERGLRLKDNRDEDLALFREMRRREKELGDHLLQNSAEFDAPLGLPGSSPMFNMPSAAAALDRKPLANDFLNSDNDKNDYEWLLTPPGTPLFPSLEMEHHKPVTSQLGTPKARPTALNSRLSNSQLNPSPRSNLSSSRHSSSSSPASTTGLRRPSSSGGSKPSTPTMSKSTLTSSSNRSTLTAPAKPTPNTSKSTPTTNSKPSRSSTPTPRATPSSPKPTTARSSTPPSRPTTRSSTPTRPTGPTPKPAPKPSSNTKPVAKNPAPPRSSSPSTRPKSWKPSEIPGFSLDAPPNLRTSISDRPPSATRGRPGPGPPSSRSSSVEPGPNTRLRRQSCSPSRNRPPNRIIHNSGSSVPVSSASRLHAKANDNVSPILVGTKMVERTVNMRKLVPPKQDSKNSSHGNLSGKSASSPDSSGFGRNLSKKSLDMAIRHMDIRRTVPGNLRPLMTSIPASSMYSVRSGPTARRVTSVSDSPLATSSNASSEFSVHNANGVEDDISSDKGIRSPPSLHGR